jgi:hypothetical protein
MAFPAEAAARTTMVVLRAAAVPDRAGRHPSWMEDMMLTTTRPVTGAAIKEAIETRDGRTLAGFYADHAVTRIIDRNNPPSKPREIRGRGAISAFWDDICSRTMTHRVDVTLSDGDRMAFTQACTYPDSARVFCIALLKLENGLIVDQTVVQAWDE